MIAKYPYVFGHTVPGMYCFCKVGLNSYQKPVV